MNQGARDVNEQMHKSRVIDLLKAILDELKLIDSRLIVLEEDVVSKRPPPIPEPDSWTCANLPCNFTGTRAEMDKHQEVAHGFVRR